MPTPAIAVIKQCEETGTLMHIDQYEGRVAYVFRCKSKCLDVTAVYKCNNMQLTSMFWGKTRIIVPHLGKFRGCHTTTTEPDLPSTIQMTSVFPSTASSNITAKTVNQASWPHQGRAYGLSPSPMQFPRRTLNKKSNFH